MSSYATHLRNAEAAFLQSVITLLHTRQKLVTAEISSSVSLNFIKFEGKDGVSGTVIVNLIDAYTCMVTITVSSASYKVPDVRQLIRQGELTARVLVDLVVGQLGKLPRAQPSAP